MPAFAYEALDAQGAQRRGVLDADTARAARGQLRAQGLVPMSVQAVGGAATDAGGFAPGRFGPRWERRLFARPALSATALTVWTRQLAGLVTAGLPLERALAALSEESTDEPQRLLVAALRAEVHAGSPFARALGQFPREFSTVYVAIVGAGEQSGELARVLEQLADDLEDQQALRARLLSAALYPAIVTAIAIAIVVFLLTSVVPQVAQVFEGTRRALPWLTTAMLGLSALVRRWGLVLLALVVIGTLAARALLRQPGARARFDAVWLRLPVLGALARGYNAARFAGTLALLAQSGVPILKALQTAADTLHNRSLRKDALDALVLVREGAPLASALAQKPRFPGLLTLFARLGEQTGQLPTMLQRAARQLSGEVQRRALRLATILEPLLIVAMGLVVMLIVLAVLLPIIQLNQWVR